MFHGQLGGDFDVSCWFLGGEYDVSYVSCGELTQKPYAVILCVETPLANANAAP